jgi:hypothetical protein
MEISKDDMDGWAASCLHMSHHGTLIQRELAKTSENARAIDLAERVQRRAWELFNDLIMHGARPPDGYIGPEDSN